MRTQRVERLLKLVQALQSGRTLTVDELAEMIGVSRRTVFRDLDVLSRAGISYTFDRTTKRYSTEQITLLPPVTLTQAEVLALMLATRSMLAQPLLGDQAAALSAGLKLESLFPPSILEACGKLLAHVEIRGTPASDPLSIADALPLLQSALAKRTKVRMRYDSYHDGKVIDIILHPYRLAYIHRGWYVIGWSEQAAAVQTFKVERILQFQRLDASYRMSPSFTLDDYFGNAWLMIRGDKPYRVKIRFLKMVAGNVDEIRWHKTQRTHFQEDGSLMFEAEVDGIDEIAWWVLGYGDQAQVLEPRELRGRVRAHAQRMLEYYKGDGRSEGG